MAGGLSRRGFHSLLCSLLNHRVIWLTEGDGATRNGILTDVSDNFVTFSGDIVYYVPIEQIVFIARN